MIQRYQHDKSMAACADIIWPDDHGTWVKWDDVKAYLESAPHVPGFDYNSAPQTAFRRWLATSALDITIEASTFALMAQAFEAGYHARANPPLDEPPASSSAASA